MFEVESLVFATRLLFVKEGFAMRSVLEAVAGPRTRFTPLAMSEKTSAVNTVVSK